MGRQFNPQITEDAAAWLFWTLAGEQGFSAALESVMNSRGAALLALKNRDNLLSRYSLRAMKPPAYQSFCEAVADYAYNKARLQENLTGIVYAEDRQTGRSPSALNATASNIAIPAAVTGDRAPLYGHLCIRHPLPAVVFGDTPPPADHFRVADVSALGSVAMMWMGVTTSERIEAGGWLVTGIFYLPENTGLSVSAWSSVIPNSVCAREGFILPGPAGPLSLKFLWD